ncbi:MAG: chloride channel protein [Acidimicrobiales bacterium]
MIGIGSAHLILRYAGKGTTASTSDEYIRVFHDRQPRLPLAELLGKLLAGVATIGMGGALGLEGPSIYAGSSLGLWVHEKTGGYFRRDEAKLLLTAGAAAGVAAVFKAPATGVIFAMEAPYRDDVTPHALLPSLLAAATSYVTFVSLVGTEPVIPFFAEGSVALAKEGDVSVLSVDLVDIAGRCCSASPQASPDGVRLADPSGQDAVQGDDGHDAPSDRRFRPRRARLDRRDRVRSAAHHRPGHAGHGVGGR